MNTIEPQRKEKTRQGPIYKVIASVLREEIQTRYNVNDVLPTQRELAQRFKTSYMTVGNAIQKLVHEGLLTRTVGMGTFVRDVRAASRGLIGIMTSCHDPVYTARCFGTIARELRKARFCPLVFGGGCTYEDELNTFNELGRFHEAGLILDTSSVQKPVKDVGILGHPPLPVVTINGPIKNCDCSQVDHRMIGVLQARHALAQGYRRVLYIETTGAVDRLSPWLEGFLATLVHEGNETPAVRIASTRYSNGVTAMDFDAFASQQVREFTQKAFSDTLAPAPDAVIVHGDRYLLPVAEVLAELKLEPGRDVQLVGADNRNLRDFPYTTVDECLDEVGHHATRLLLDRIEGRYAGPPQIHVVSPKLVQYS